MLKITIGDTESYDEEKNEFSVIPGDCELLLEHSLLSLSKWESDYQKPFLAASEKTNAEMYGYLKAMVVTGNPDDLDGCTTEVIRKIQAYIDSPQSATTFGQMPGRRGPGEVITSELIYYWMIAFNIPFECERWHLNRLFSLIRICNIKSNPPKKMSRNEIAQRNRELNEQRRAALGTRG